jgi:hypothetical protein
MAWLRLTERGKERLAGLATVVVCVAVGVMLGQQAWKFLNAVWQDHWIRKDAEPVTAIVTQVGPKRTLVYRYTMDGRAYAGRDSRDWEDEKDHPVNVGDQVAARVSASHPWLSALGSTGRAWMGLPIFLAICVFELMLLGVLLSGILRIIFGFSLVKDEDSPVTGLIVSTFFLVFLAWALLGRRKNRTWQFRIYRREG